MIPTKKKPGQKNLGKKTKKHNTFINTHRYVIENAIAHVTT
ncbi:hypothetical protein [Rathayibacter toxicus]|nr:hypothetical protein [Rathayibacter toxicus]